MALKAARGDAEPRRHGVQLAGIVRHKVRPAVLALADGGPLAPVVDVDGQGRAQGRARRTVIGCAHQRPLKRQASCTGFCASGSAGRGQTSWAAAVMAAMASGLGAGTRPQGQLRRIYGREGPGGGGARRRFLAHSGTLPCLRRGSSSCLEARISRLRQMTARVSAGEITSSM